MTVDLSNLKVGDTVHPKCGCSIVVPEDFSKFPPKFVTIGEHSWSMNGKYYGGHKDSPFDIVAVTPKPEPKRIKGWVNFYANEEHIWMDKVIFNNKEDADKSAIINKVGKHFACIYIDVAEGEGLE